MPLRRSVITASPVAPASRATRSRWSAWTRRHSFATSSVSWADRSRPRSSPASRRIPARDRNRSVCAAVTSPRVETVRPAARSTPRARHAFGEIVGPDGARASAMEPAAGRACPESDPADRRAEGATPAQCALPSRCVSLLPPRRIEADSRERAAGSGFRDRSRAQQRERRTSARLVRARPRSIEETPRAAPFP